MLPKFFSIKAHESVRAIVDSRRRMKQHRRGIPKLVPPKQFSSNLFFNFSPTKSEAELRNDTE